MSQPLSPAAKAVLKLNDPMDKEWQEFLSECLRAQAIAEREGYEFPYYLDDKAQELKARLCAAAICAAADQVVPEAPARTDRAAQRRLIRAAFLAITAELDNA